MSEDALALAAENAESLGLSNRFKPLLGNLLEPLAGYPGVAKAAESGQGSWTTVSNPPYIPDHEWNEPDQMGKNVKGHEPDLALRGGADGLSLFARSSSKAPSAQTRWPASHRDRQFVRRHGVLAREGECAAAQPGDTQRS